MFRFLTTNGLSSPFAEQFLLAGTNKSKQMDHDLLFLTSIGGE